MNPCFWLALTLAPISEARVATVDGLVIGPRMRQVFAGVKTAADARKSLAETGSGKEMVARAFHDCFSPKGPFVPLNCAALPATLAEGMLFGVERGADSGATASRAGYLAQGDGGVSAARPSPARTLAARPVRIAPVRSLSDPGGIDAP